MDWIRIMNKRPKKADGKEETQRFLTQLIPEINLRLLLETEALSGRILWVESVTVTAYQSAPVKKSSGKGVCFRKRLPAPGDTGTEAQTGSPSGRMWHRLMGMLGKALSLKK